MLNYYYRTKGYVRANMIHYGVNIEWRYHPISFEELLLFQLFGCRRSQ